MHIDKRGKIRLSQQLQELWAYSMEHTVWSRGGSAPTQTFWSIYDDVFLMTSCFCWAVVLPARALPDDMNCYVVLISTPLLLYSPLLNSAGALKGTKKCCFVTLQQESEAKLQISFSNFSRRHGYLRILGLIFFWFLILGQSLPIAVLFQSGSKLPPESECPWYTLKICICNKLL